MVFVYFLAFSAFLLASVAGYFSIYGLASIFSGWFWEIIAMGIALEYAKLVAVSYIYRYAFLEGVISKLYGYIGIIVLMVITSAGIFGFLSQGYQQDTLALKQQEQRIELLVLEQEELVTFKEENILRKKQIDKDIASLPNDYITGRQRLMESYGGELLTIREDIAMYTKQINEKTLKISELKQEKLITEVHIGPIIFIAEAFNTDTDEAVKWLIFMLIFVFDPMAVWLTIGTNKVLLHEGRQIKIKPKMKKVMEPSPPKNDHALLHVDNPVPKNVYTENSDNTPAHSLRRKK